MIEGSVSIEEKAYLEVDRENRLAIARNHSSTHLLHKALREIIGNHVEQAGSHVSPERLRFDFVHFSALSSEEILKVEEMVNKKIYSPF